MNLETDHGGEIEWPERPEIVKPADWEAGKQVVEWLCELGEVTERYAHGTSEGIPLRYVIDGEKVTFPPHSTCYTISRNLLRRPTSREEILRDVQAVKTLNLAYLAARRAPPTAPPQAQA